MCASVVYSLCMLTYAPEVESSLIALQDAFVWETPSHVQYQRSPTWYLSMGVLSLFLLAYAIWQENFLFAFFILLADIVLIVGNQREARPVLVQIGDNGVAWDGALHLFQDLEHFAIIYDPPYAKTLYIQKRSGINPTIHIDLGDQDPVAIREHLRQYLRENLDLSTEYSSDILGRLLRI